MYAYLIGKIAYMESDSVVIEVGNIGYNVKVSAQTVQHLSNMAGEVKIYTYTYVKEDAFSLFGFLTRDELEFFKKMITVNGIGPKGALAILSTLSVDALRLAILSGDAKSIAKSPGIGAKTAERLIIDLKDKVELSEVFSNGNGADNMGTVAQEYPAKTEAMEALVALGYSPSDAIRAIGQVVCNDSTTVEEVLKDALKKISGF